MSYKENSDYININLKRQATEDELQLLNYFWNEILPYRFLSNTNKKLFKKSIFGENELNKIIIKNHQLQIKSDKTDRFNYVGSSIKKMLTKGIIPQGVILNASNSDNFFDIGKYFHVAGIPVIGEKLNYNETNPDIDTYSFSFPHKKLISKNKTSNGLNVIVVGENITVSEKNMPDCLMQKKLLDFSSEVFDKKLVTSTQSCEKGIFSAVLKLITGKNSGIFINLNNLHKEEGEFKAWEYLTAKTPEIMLFSVHNWKLVEFIKIIDKYELPFSIIGKIDNSKSVKVFYKNSQTIFLNKKLIFDPILKIEDKKNDNYDKNYEFGENINSENVEKIISDIKFSGSENKNLFNRYVGNKTDWVFEKNNISELWYKNLKHFISLTTDSNNIHFTFNPYVAGQNVVFENARKLTAFGHTPIGISINYHFDFNSPNAVTRFNEFRDGINFAVKKLKIKVLNINFSNAEKTGFSVLMAGKKKKKEKLFVPYFENAQKVYLIGKPDNLPATSSYQEILNNKIYPYPDEVNYKFEKKLLKCIKKLQKSNLISCIIPIDRFGIAKALLNGLSVKKLGFKGENNNLNLNYFFNEIQSRFLVSTNDDIIPILERYKIPYMLLGKTKSPDYIELCEVKLNCNTLYGN